MVSQNFANFYKSICMDFETLLVFITILSQGTVWFSPFTSRNRSNMVIHLTDPWNPSYGFPLVSRMVPQVHAQPMFFGGCREGTHCCKLEKIINSSVTS